MFQQKVSIPLLRSLPFMSHSIRSITNRRNPFVKEKLPALPVMETILPRDGNIETLVDTHLSCRKVTYGDYDFFECKEGYILCYINAYLRKKAPQKAFYGVYYGADHPLNNHGPVKGLQSLTHAKDNAIVNAIQTFPKMEAKKLCICTDCTRTIKMMGRLQEYSENGYRRVSDGKVLEIKDTYVALTKALRLRDDLQLRFLYTPSDVVYVMKQPLKLATLASKLDI